MPAEFEINLESFSFPEALADNHANFRFVIDVRLVRSGRFASDTIVMPGFDTWWNEDSPLNQLIDDWGRKTNRRPAQVNLRKLELCGQYAFHATRDGP